MTTTPIPFDYKSLLGGRCLTKRNCHTSTAICRQSICTCPKGYFPVDDWTCLEEPGIKQKRNHLYFVSFLSYKTHLMKNLFTQHPPFLQQQHYYQQQHQSFVGGHGHRLRQRLGLMSL